MRIVNGSRTRSIAGLLVGLFVGSIGFQTVAAESEALPFDTWLADLRSEARSRGISDAVLDQTLDGVSPITRVIELDRRQPEFTLTFWSYFDRAISTKRIERGRLLLREKKALLDTVSRKFGVQPRFLVAFWGLESNFGDYTGSFPLIGALVTLAHDRRRARFFREQLLAALSLVADGHIPAGAKASWAGAMGNHQFIPTTYRDFAYDFDGDGRRDLWNSEPDIFASAANYLSRSGWDNRRTWGREVRLPDGFDYELSGLGTRKPLKDWQRLGVRKADGGNLPAVEIDASLVLPGGYTGPTFLVYKNYRTILVWNRSILYALAVGYLADRLVGKGPLKARRPANDAPLSRADVKRIQTILSEKGYDTGGADGVAGPMTRKAIKAFQKSVRLPADGYPSMGLLERLTGTGG